MRQLKATLAQVEESGRWDADGITLPAKKDGATYTLSGGVTGPWTEGITVALGGDASATTTTSAAGAYSFQGLYAGTYTVAPSLPDARWVV